MKVWTTSAVTLTVLVAAGIGAAVAPVPSGQDRDMVWTRGDTPSIVQVLTGGGSQIGVSVRDIDAEEVTRLKLPAVGGVFIEDVQEDSPAAKAGIRDGDVVVEFDGERVRSTRQFTRLVQETPAERPVPAIVLRDGQRVPLTVQPRVADNWRGFRDFSRFGDMPPTPAPPPPPAKIRPPSVEVFPRLERWFVSTGRLGITVEALSDQLANYFGTKDGVLVTSVADNSAASKAGLKAGDVVTGINGGTVTTPSDLSRRTERLEDGDEFTLEVVRDKKPMTLKGKVEPRQPRRWTSRTML
jgi:serine protease Do